MPKLTQRHVDIIEAIYGLNIDLARGNDDERRIVTNKIAEQFAFEFGPTWGTKSSTPTHPPSKDVVAKMENGRLYGWDWQNGTTRAPQVHVGQEAEDMTGQHFILVVPTNHLADVPEDPDEPDDPTEPEKDLILILADLKKQVQELKDNQKRLMAGQETILAAVQVLIDKPDPEIVIIPKYPEYEGSAWFGKITLTPREENKK